MNRISKLLFLFIFCFFLVLPSVSADVQRVYDQAGILSDEEVAALEKRLQTFLKSGKQISSSLQQNQLKVCQL